MPPISEYFGGNGEKVMKSMKKTYGGEKEAKRVFYATANARANSKEGGKPMKATKELKGKKMGKMKAGKEMGKKMGK